jgi:hypothetical protein
MKKILLIVGILFVSINSMANDRCEKDDDCVASPEVNPCLVYDSGSEGVCRVFNKSLKKENQVCKESQHRVRGCLKPKVIKCVNHVCHADGKPNRGPTGHAPHKLEEFTKNKNISTVVAKINFDSAVVAGPLTKEQIFKAVESYMGQIQYCYERKLLDQPDLKGNVAVTFEVPSSGCVINSAKVSNSTMASPPVEGCVKMVFNRICFPSVSSGSTNATVPLEFSKK